MSTLSPTAEVAALAESITQDWRAQACRCADAAHDVCGPHLILEGLGFSPEHPDWAASPVFAVRVHAWKWAARHYGQHDLATDAAAKNFAYAGAR